MASLWTQVMLLWKFIEFLDQIHIVLQLFYGNFDIEGWIIPNIQLNSWSIYLLDIVYNGTYGTKYYFYVIVWILFKVHVF